MEEVLEQPPVLAPSRTRLNLQIPLPKMLTVKEELLIARKAFEKNPASPALLYRLASLLVELDHFHEAIALLESHKPTEFRHFRFLYDAYLGLETQEDTLRARTAAELALQAASTPRQRAIALADLAKTYTRFDEVETSKGLLLQALEEDPHDKDAYKRLSRIYLRQDPEKALQLAQNMMERNVLHARVLGSVPLALARLGRFAEAHEAEALDEFLLSKTPEPPPGWDSLEAFNAALTEEILNHPDMRYERYGTASAKTWRVDEPSIQRSRVFPQLQQLIRREVMAYAARMPESNHPMARACPQHASLRNWCVVTQGEGHETWHVHQNGWMSGVYYIHIQDHIARGTGPEGCLAFGISDEIAGDQAAAGYGERLVRPQTGLMMIFPSHSFHKTYPHRGSGHRICFAFDIIPSNEED